MKVLVIFGILMVVACGEEVPKETQENSENRAPRNICANNPSGTTFPVAHDCNQFILCVNSVATIGSCPPGSPYFDPCTFTCSYSPYVCFRTFCYETTTIPSWTTIVDETTTEQWITTWSIKSLLLNKLLDNNDNNEANDKQKEDVQ